LVFWAQGWKKKSAGKKKKTPEKNVIGLHARGGRSKQKHRKAGSQYSEGGEKGGIFTALGVGSGADNGAEGDRRDWAIKTGLLRHGGGGNL